MSCGSTSVLLLTLDRAACGARLFPANGAQLCLANEAITDTEKLAGDIHRLGNERSQTSGQIRACKHHDVEFAATIAHQQAGRYASADATRCTVAVYLTGARVHNAEIALAVDNLAGE